MSALKEYRPATEAHEDFWSDLGIPNDATELHAAIHEGFHYAVYANLAAILGMDRKELAKYAMIPQTTLQRRYKSDRFSADESDRLYRMAEVTKAALDLFEGNAEQARHWLANPALALGGRRPLDMLSTSAEAGSVLTAIGRIEYGVYL